MTKETEWLESLNAKLEKIYGRLGWIMFWIIILGIAIASNTGG